MFCPECNAEMGTTRGRYQFRECGLDFVWLDNWPMYVCPDGHAKMPSLLDADRMNAAITRELVRAKEVLSADAVLFLRESMGLRSQELADLLETSRIEVSRWENGHSRLSPINDFRLRLTAIDRILPVSEQRDIRSEIAMLFQRFFPEKSGVPDHPTQISVPPMPELLEAR